MNSVTKALFSMLHEGHCAGRRSSTIHTKYDAHDERNRREPRSRSEEDSTEWNRICHTIEEVLDRHEEQHQSTT